MQKADFIKYVTQILLFLNVIVVTSIFRVRDYADKSLDLQVMLKLGVWAATFLIALFLMRLWMRRFLQIDQILLFILFALVGVSCLYAPNLTYSAASAFSLLSVVLLLFLSSSVLTTREIMRTIIAAVTLVAVVSILVYFVNPEFGRMKNWTENGLVPGVRLSGITGTANTIGYLAAFCLLLLYYYRLFLPRGISITYWACVAVHLIALGMSQSRTSMAALILSLLIATTLRASPMRLGLLCLLIAGGIAFFSFVDLDSVFALVSRSGNVSEITTGTGRTHIWGVSMDMIAQRPLFGWGYASSNVLLPAVSGDIGHSVTHAHNGFLQIALSVGLVGLFVFLALMAVKTYYAFRARDQFHIALIFFLLIDGMTEPVAFYGVAGATTLVLATVLALNYKDQA